MAASQVDQGWSLDFLSDEVVAEKKTRILNVLDEYSRKCLFVVAQSSFKAKKLVAHLEQMVVAHGNLQYIRCDNGPKLISAVMVKFGLKHGPGGRCHRNSLHTAGVSQCKMDSLNG